MAKLPKTLKIGPYVYTVSVQEDMKSPNGDYPVWGWHSLGRLSICLEKNIPTSIQKMALLHEILHACFSLAEIGGDPSKDPIDLTEEDIICRLTPCLLQTFIDNPKLMEYIRHA